MAGYKNLGIFALYVGIVLLVIVQQRQVGSSAFRDQYTAVREQIFGFVDEATGLHLPSLQSSCLFLKAATIFSEHRHA